jgi:hypothetical protein
MAIPVGAGLDAWIPAPGVKAPEEETAPPSGLENEGAAPKSV